MVSYILLFLVASAIVNFLIWICESGATLSDLCNYAKHRPAPVMMRFSHAVPLLLRRGRGEFGRGLPQFSSLCSGLSTLIVLLFLVKESSQQKDPIQNFCRRFGHQTAVIDRKLYIDGGLINWNPIPQYPTNYSSKSNGSWTKRWISIVLIVPVSRYLASVPRPRSQ